MLRHALDLGVKVLVVHLDLLDLGDLLQDEMPPERQLRALQDVSAATAATAAESAPRGCCRRASP